MLAPDQRRGDRMMNGGPTSAGYICNDKDNRCEFLHSWFNGGFSVYGECKKEVWKGIKSWEPMGECKTPEICPLLIGNDDDQGDKPMRHGQPKIG